MLQNTNARKAEAILHDLRNPLSAISSAAEMMMDPAMPPAQITRLAGNICRASGRMQDLLREFLDASRNTKTEMELCSLRDIAIAACESMSARAEQCCVALEVAIAPDFELPLQRGRIERALANLITNAIEAMHKGGTIRIWSEFVGGAAFLHVDDSGPGVAQAIRHKVCQPFVTAGKRNGIGLGLAIVKQTLVEHGGDLLVGTAPGGGARFSLRLPVCGRLQNTNCHVGGQATDESISRLSVCS